MFSVCLEEKEGSVRGTDFFYTEEVVCMCPMNAGTLTTPCFDVGQDEVAIGVVIRETRAE